MSLTVCTPMKAYCGVVGTSGRLVGVCGVLKIDVAFQHRYNPAHVIYDSGRSRQMP
jgi:hypothetical protein